MGSKRKYEYPEVDSAEPPPFSFLTYRSDIEAALKYYRLVQDWVEFWHFAGKMEALHLSRPPYDVSRRLCIQVNVTAQSLEKRVGSRHLTETRLQQLLLIVQAFLSFKQTEKFGKLRKLRMGQKALPVAAFERHVVEILRRDRVLIVAGDTGCGKSTQVPQFLMRRSNARVLCTQPRRLACISLASRLKYETLSEYSQLVGYQIRFERKRNTDTRLLFMTEGLLLRQLAADPGLTDWDVVILDEVHERHLHGDLLLGLLTCLLQQRNGLRLILMSATINTQLFLNYFNGRAQLLQVPGRLFPVGIRYILRPKIECKPHPSYEVTRYLQILEVIEVNFRGQKGDVLIFLSGAREIATLVVVIEEWSRKEGIESWIVLPLHSGLALGEQDRVFQNAPEGVRKCIVATNIAETSLTIDGIRFVIDSGKVKEMSYDPVTRIQRLKEFWVSKSSAEQRRGRAGRTGPGICFRVYSEEVYADFNDFPTPEIRRVPLDSTILQVMAMGLPDVRRFPFVEPPDAEDLEESIANLKQLDALTNEEKLTLIGKQLANLPVDVNVGKMLIAGCIFRQTELALLLAAVLSVPTPLTQEGQRDLSCEKVRGDLESPFGDPVSLIAIFRHWLELKSNNENTRQWSRNCGLEEQRFYEITKLRMQLKETLTESGLIDEPEKFATTSAERRIRSGEVKLLRALKTEAESKPTNKELKRKAEDEDGFDVRDVEFRLRSDPYTVAQLLTDSNMEKRLPLMILRAIFCFGLYPQFAIADEHNGHGPEPVYHTKTKAYVFIHPSSYFFKHPEILQINESDVVIPNNGVRYASRSPFSQRHQILCYLGMLETSRIYLTTLLRMPALQTCLLFCKQIDTSFDFSKIVCDGWLLFEPLHPEDLEPLILKATDLRKQWSRAIERRVMKTAVSGEARTLADDLDKFFGEEIVYGIKRLLPADLYDIYTQSPGPDLEKNPFDPEFPAITQDEKGGTQVTDYLTYNCVIPNEGQDAFGDNSFVCPRCGVEETLNALQRLLHRVDCIQKPADVSSSIRKEETPTYTCDVCLSNRFTSSIDFLRHKRNCKSSSS